MMGAVESVLEHYDVLVHGSLAPARIDARGA
jgi:hypothetical protein